MDNETDDDDNDDDNDDEDDEGVHKYMDIEAEEEEDDDDYIENDEEEDDYTGIGSLQKIRDNLNEEKTKESHNETDEAVANKYSGFKNSSITKAPTNEEIQELKETADLFKSNIFKLQVSQYFNIINLLINSLTYEIFK